MLPKFDTESLGLSRSYGEQGRMPRNMQGKKLKSFILISYKTLNKADSFKASTLVDFMERYEVLEVLIA